MDEQARLEIASFSESAFGPFSRLESNPQILATKSNHLRRFASFTGTLCMKLTRKASLVGSWCSHPRLGMMFSPAGRLAR
jgi:hypothetical protein